MLSERSNSSCPLAVLVICIINENGHGVEVLLKESRNMFMWIAIFFRPVLSKLGKMRLHAIDDSKTGNTVIEVMVDS